MDLRKRRMLCAGVAVCLSVLGGCAAMSTYEPVTVNVSDLRMGTAGVFEQQYFVKLRVQNPTDRDIAMKGLVFDLELNGKHFARGTTGQAITIPRFGSEVVEVETLSTLTGILRQLGTVAGGAEPMKSFEYRIRGKLYRAGMGGAIPFDDRGDVSLGGAAETPAPASK